MKGILKNYIFIYEERKMEQEIKQKENKILDFFITTLNGMAFGLFATLIVGTIIGSIGSLFTSFAPEISKVLKDTSTLLSCLTGAGIGIGVSLSLKMDTLKTIVIASIGEISSYFSLTTKFVSDGTFANTFKIGDPLTIYIVVIISCLLLKIIFQKKTPVDILLIPLCGIIVGLIFSILIRYPIIYVTFGIQYIVNEATLIQPILMGIIISVIMGMALTAPISSAAIAAMIFIGDGQGLLIASGAALIGCCTQMVGFAVQSRKDNSLGMVLSIGIGTSMLQFKNILKKPIIWLPTIIASSILGPISTTLIKLQCMGSSAGMGTAGFVGQIGTIATMGNNLYTWLIIIFFEIIAPSILVFIIDLIFRKFNLIKDGDLKI